MTKCYRKECIFHDKNKLFGHCKEGHRPCPHLLIELDKWDSQFIYLAKNHFSDDIWLMIDEEVNIAKKIWSDRCGIDLKYIELNSLLSHLILLCKKFGCFENEHALINFIENISPFNKYMVKSTDKIEITPKDYNKYVFNACSKFLHLLQIKEEDMSGNLIEIIKLQPIMEKYKLEQFKEEGVQK